MAQRLSFLVLFVWGVAAGARADFEANADTVFQAYEVNSPGSLVRYTRRRLLQTVDVGYQGALKHRDPWRVGVFAALRLETELGDACLRNGGGCFRRNERSDPTTFQPLLDEGGLDLPALWFEVARSDGRLSARAGRQLHWDSIGMVRLDGLELASAPVEWLRVEGYGGLQVLGTSVLGDSRFDPRGALRVDLPNLFDNGQPEFEEQRVWVAGAALEGGLRRIVRSSVRFREVQQEGDVVFRWLGIGASSQPELGAARRALRLQADAVWELHQHELARLHASVEYVVRDVTLRAHYEQERPVFDAGTIWGYFTIVPVSHVRSGVSWKANSELVVGGELRARFAEVSGTHEHDLGAALDLRWLPNVWRFGADAWLWDGELGRSGALSVDVGRRIRHRADVYSRLSLWYFDDELREGLHAASLHTMLGSKIDITEITFFRAEFEYAYNRVVGNRFRTLAWLGLRVWQ